MWYISCGFFHFRNQSIRSSSKDLRYFVRIKHLNFLRQEDDRTNLSLSSSGGIIHSLKYKYCALRSPPANKNHNSPMNNLWRPNDRQSLIYSLHAALKVPIFTLDNDPRLYWAQCILWLILFDKYNTNHRHPPTPPPPHFSSVSSGGDWALSLYLLDIQIFTEWTSNG